MFKKLIPTLLTVLALVFGLYLLNLYRQITSKFEAHRWNLPSRIYSDSFPVYAGRPLTPEALQEKLDYLGYRQIKEEPTNHGEFRRNNNLFEIFLHSFAYPNQKFEGYPVIIELAGNRVVRLAHEGESLDLVRLEPELIASVFDEKMEDRTVVHLAEVPPILAKAIVAVEDERYWHHSGIDPMAIGRATLKNLLALKLVEGGSTLTQQLIKNFFLYPRKSFVRKINEAFMALLMEARYSKKEILEAYLNEIYLGQKGATSIAGAAEAARYYFSRNVSQLSISESALLAGMIRSPGLYSPFNNPDRALLRRNFVLKKLLNAGIISQKEYDESSSDSLPKKKKEQKNTSAPFFVDYIKTQLRENFPAEKLSSEGLNIFTTLDMGLQRTAEESMEVWLARLEKDHTNLKAKAEQGIDLQSAFLAIAPQTGVIRAYVGGRNYAKSQFDHVTMAHRQPGSAFKPFVYLSALLNRDQQEKPYTLASLIDDTPYDIKNDGQNWSPQNYDRQFHGRVSLRTALEKSYNIATARLAMTIGLADIIATAQMAGISSPLKEYPSMVLGSFEVNPMELIEAYSVFPNQGIRSQPVAIKQVVTPEGETLEQKDLEMKRVFPEDVIYLMNRLLMGVIDNGTATLARGYGLKTLAAGKTGTTSDNRDSWFVGYTPELLALSWVGYDDNSKTGLSGAGGALPIWTAFMKKATDGLRYTDFPQNPDVIRVVIDKKTGLNYDKACGEPAEEYFIKGTEPDESCNPEAKHPRKDM